MINIIPGRFVSEESYFFDNCIEIRQEVSKPIIDTLYLFILKNKPMLDIKEFLQIREYESARISLDSDIVTAFIESHYIYKKIY